MAVEEGSLHEEVEKGVDLVWKEVEQLEHEVPANDDNKLARKSDSIFRSRGTDKSWFVCQEFLFHKILDLLFQ